MSYSCDATNSNDIDPSILIFKSKNATESLEKTPIIVANQTDYLAHQVKKFTSFNQYTFAYASMASLRNLFEKIHFINEPAEFVNAKDLDLEHVPHDKIMDRLRAKTF